MICVLARDCVIQEGAWVLRQVTLVAAANIEEPGTSVAASTLHNTFGFDGEYESKLDFSHTTDQKVAELIGLQLLLMDEVSMLDVDIVASVFSLALFVFRPIGHHPGVARISCTGEGTLVHVGGDDENPRSRRSCSPPRL